MLSASEIAGFCYFFSTNSRKIKVDSKNFWLGVVKNGYGHSDQRILKLDVT